MALRAFEQQGVGERLRHAREERGLDLDHAATETRIERRFLEALESDAPTDVYPGPLFARSFLREYARYLGLNPRPLIEAYRAAHPERDWPFIGSSEPAQRRSGWARGGLAALAVTAAVVLTVVVARPEGTDTLRVPDMPATEAPVRGEIEPRGPVGPTYRGIVLRLRVVDASCWIAVVADGEDVIRETRDPGFSETFRARRTLDVVLGNADAVRMTLNGRPLSPDGAIGDVWEATIVFRDGRVRVSPAA